MKAIPICLGDLVLHFSSFITTLSYMALPLLIYYMCGYVVLNKMLRINLRRNYGIWVSLPIYLSAGVVLYTFILYVIGLIVLNGSVATLLAIVISLSFLGDIMLSAKRSDATTIKMALNNLRGVRLKDLPDNVARASPGIIAGLVFLVSFLYLTNVITIFGWPPSGDIIDHGFYTSLIIYDQKIPLYSHYPLGLHVESAFLALLLGIYPGESVLLFGGILMIALISLTFALTYVITGSSVLAVSAYTLTYLAYSAGTGGGNLEEWLFGYLFNGPYPNIFGSLIVLLSVTAIVIQAKTKDSYVLLRFCPIMIIVLLLTYPSFVLISLLVFAFAVLQFGVTNTFKSCFRTRRDILTTCFLAIFVIYFILYIYFTYFNILSAKSGVVLGQYYSVPQEYLLGSIFGVSIILAFVFSCLLITLGFIKAIRGSSLSSTKGLIELRPLLLTYVLTTLALFMSLNAGSYAFLQYLLPARLSIIVMVLSLVLNIYALSRAFDIVMNRLFRFVAVEKRFAPAAIGNLRTSTTMARMRRSMLIRKLRRSAVTGRGCRSAPEKILPIARDVAVALIVLALFSTNGLLAYSLSSQANLNFANYYSWFSHSGEFKDDFQSLEWINANVSSRDLILNDWSWSGLYLLSLSIKNVSMRYALIDMNRTRDLQQVWVDTDNRTLVYSLLKKYNVTYIFTTSEWTYLDVYGTGTFKRKPNSPLGYMNIFISDWFLVEVFRSGLSAVFRVR